MKKVILTAFFIAAPMAVALVMAQPGGGPTPVPLDGGLSLLVIAGAGYGAKKLHEYNKKKKNQK